MPDSSRVLASETDVDIGEFRAAMGSFAAGVTVITTLDAEGRPWALTATAFSSVSADPPMCLVCVHKKARAYRPLVDHKRFAVNILTAEQAWLSARCAAAVDDRLASIEWTPGAVTRSPVIAGVLAWMECELAERHSSGDHDIIVGRLRSVHVREGAPLLYWRGDYLTGIRSVQANDNTPPQVPEAPAPPLASIEGLDSARDVPKLPELLSAAPLENSPMSKPSTIPDEYAKYLVDQEHGRYTAEQHDVWREVMDRNQRMIAEYGNFMHPTYVEGMKLLGLPRNHIPRLEEINDRLAPTGWRTVCVGGYVPSSAYAGLMARKIFPVSRQIRRREHIDFAPAPDMVHDILGHLAMLYLPRHREFLRQLSEVMAYSIANELDEEFYSASVRMADLKWDPASDPDEVLASEQRVSDVHKRLAANASELTHLRRMYVWSVEFGLMGSGEDFTVFGAAFFSSPAEFAAVCNGSARVLPYSMDVIHYENAFSDLLPQYFVTRDFGQLEAVLDQYALRQSHRGEPPRTSEIRDIRPGTKKRSGNA